MIKNVLEWLEMTEKIYPAKIAFFDEQEAIPFREVARKARVIGSNLAMSLPGNAPIVILTERKIITPVIYLGVAYSGHVYVPLDYKLPEKRLMHILNILNPCAIIIDEDPEQVLDKVLNELNVKPDIFQLHQLLTGKQNDDLLKKIRKNMVMTDPLYIIYTSGSSGNPKGVVTSHQSLMCYIEAYAKVMKITDDDCLGNQSSLDYIAAIRDIYLPVRFGCSAFLIPKAYFMEPNKLFDSMNRAEVTCAGWSVSALTIPLKLGAFEEVTLETIRKICFSGSVMPCSCLKRWQEELPKVKFVNQYGPTETTASCTYYVVDHKVSEEEVLPLGIPYDNYRIYVMDESLKEVPKGEKGEICVGGPALALGYYNDYDRTSKSFVKNGDNSGFEERIYKTGDYGVIREDGLLEFHGRMDRQVKYMGHRVELDEVEYTANRHEKIAECCCIYKEDNLYLVYAGTIEKRELTLWLREYLPSFMVPRKIIKKESLTKLPNGKIDIHTIKMEV